MNGIGLITVGVAAGITIAVCLILIKLLSKKHEASTQVPLDKELQSLRELIHTQSQEQSKWIFERLSDITSQMNTHLQNTSHLLEKANFNMGERLEGASSAVRDVVSKLGQLEESNKRIFDVGKDIASLQEILRAPKLRGVLGELFLGDLLAQIFPAERFMLQYRFNSGEAVDAVIVMQQGLVPVDSKFPLENFRKVLQEANEDDKKKIKKQFVSDVKKHIDAIASKYILPDEGTFDFAFMYVPAENVYYEVIIKDDDSTADKMSLVQYALQKRVIPTSPNSFYAFLQAILLGLKGMRVEEKAHEILKYLSGLQGEMGKFSNELDKLGTHLNHAVTAYQRCEKKIDKISTKLSALDGDKKITVTDSESPLLINKED